MPSRSAGAAPPAWGSLCGQDGDDLVLQQLHSGGALCCDVIGLLEGITSLIAVTELIYIKQPVFSPVLGEQFGTIRCCISGNNAPMRMRRVRPLDASPGETVFFVLLVIDNLKRNEGIPSLINSVPDGLFMK